MRDAELPELALGVGSVTDAPAASLYMMLEADFTVTPTSRGGIALVCKRRKVVWYTGCATVAEIARAEESGAEVVELFSSGTYGPGLVEGTPAPQPWTGTLPTGGMSSDRENLEGWFDAGVECVEMGLRARPVARSRSSRSYDGNPRP